MKSNFNMWIQVMASLDVSNMTCVFVLRKINYVMCQLLTDYIISDLINIALAQNNKE